ncbi:MAG TPA: esterase [Bacteroidales bacterium]|nr:esterase [Bacteroidales bacterium]
MTRRLLNVIFLTIIIGSNQSLYSQSNYQFKIGLIDSVYSNILNESKEIYIQVPASYSPEKHQKYPVVFILDGEVYLPALNSLHDFYSGGFIPEMVLVGISNDKHRTRDLTPSKIKTKYGMPFNEENGEADNFRKFFEKELIPFVENKYPVSSYRTLIGHSYGGLFTIYTLLNYPNLFDNYISIDPSLDWDKQKLLKEAQELIPIQKYEGKSLYVSLSGQLNMQDSKVTIDNVMQDTTDYTLFARSNISFSNLVKQNTKNRLLFEWEFFPQDLHGTVALPSIRNSLITLFSWFQMENTDKFNSFDTSQEELYEIIQYRAKKLKSHFGYQEPPYPEDILNMLGYMNMDMQQLEKAKMYFELTIEYYPKSANAYDSMADYYANQKDFENAIKYITKAFEISGNTYFKEKIDDYKKKKNN